MKIRARIHNEEGQHRVDLSTNDAAHSLNVPPKSNGVGSDVNGGEMLFLALATCYCNDLYREAAKAGIIIVGVEVEVEGEFGGVGEPARNVSYRAKVIGRGTGKAELLSLLERTDEVAEIQNTLRSGVAVRLVEKQVEIVD